MLACSTQSPNRGPFTPWTRHLTLPAGLSQSQQQRQQQQASNHQTLGPSRRLPQPPPSWTPGQPQQPPIRPSWGTMTTATAHSSQQHPPLASRLVENRAEQVRIQEQQQQEQQQQQHQQQQRPLGSVSAGAMFTAIACPPPPAEGSTVPWSEAEAKGDHALGEALRLACSIHAIAEAAVGGGGDQQLSADELHSQMTAVLPFLTARHLKPQVLELSRVAEAALKAAASATDMSKQTAAGTTDSILKTAAPALFLPSSVALPAPYAAVLSPVAPPSAAADLVCEVCGSPDGESTMLLCDLCDKGWHCRCLMPPLRAVPQGTWTCPDCPNPQQRRGPTQRPSDRAAVAPGGQPSLLDLSRSASMLIIGGGRHSATASRVGQYPLICAHRNGRDVSFMVHPKKRPPRSPRPPACYTGR